MLKGWVVDVEWTALHIWERTDPSGGKSLIYPAKDDGWSKGG